MRASHMTINKNELPGNFDQNYFEFDSQLMNKDCESPKYFNALKSFKDARNSKDYKDFRDFKKSGHSTDSRYLNMGKMLKFLKNLKCSKFQGY